MSCVDSGLGAPNATPEAGVMACVDTKLDGSTLIVRIPMRFQHRGGRKRIVAPNGSELH